MSIQIQCPDCGQIHPYGACSPANRTPDDEAIVAYNKLLAETPDTPVTYGLLAINVLLFVLMSVACMNVLTPPTNTLLQFGASWGPVTMTTEPWRLVTAMFVHIGIIHIAFNMYALWNIGPFAEKLLGSTGMLIAYFAAGVVGSISSIWFNPLVTSAGASGAIFGIFGVVFGILIGGRRLLPRELSRRLMPQMGYILVANLVMGYSIANIDNAAHIGGLVFGCIVGFAAGLFIRRPKLQRMMVVSVIAIVGLAGSAGLYGYIAETSTVGYYGRTLIVLEDFSKSSRQYEAQQITAEAFANDIETNILPAWSDLGAELEDDTRQPPAGTGSIEDWREAHRQQAADWLEVADLLKAASPTAG